MAVADSSCRKLSAVRSPVSTARALPCDLEQQLTGRDSRSLAGRPSESEGRIQLAEGFRHPRRAAQHGILTRDDMPARLLSCGNELRGDIARANVFAKCRCDLFARSDGSAAEEFIGQGSKSAGYPGRPGRRLTADRPPSRLKC